MTALLFRSFNKQRQLFQPPPLDESSRTTCTNGNEGGEDCVQPAFSSNKRRFPFVSGKRGSTTTIDDVLFPEESIVDEITRQAELLFTYFQQSYLIFLFFGGGYWRIFEFQPFGSFYSKGEGFCNFLANFSVRS